VVPNWGAPDIKGEKQKKWAFNGVIERGAPGLKTEKKFRRSGRHRKGR